MRTHLTNVGTALPDRALAPQLRRAPGLWRYSSFKAKLCEISGGNIVASTFLQTGSTGIPVFLFLQDAPTTVLAYSRYAGIRIVDAPTGEFYDIPRLDFLEDCNFLGDAGAAPMSTVLTAASVTNGAAGVNAGARVAATTLTNTIAVQGYPFIIALEDQSLQDLTPADIDPVVMLKVRSRGVVADGPISTGELLAYSGTGTDDGTGTAYPQRNCILLQESDYTAAMLADGNQWTDGNGLVVDIVGLFAIPT